MAMAKSRSGLVALVVVIVATSLVMSAGANAPCSKMPMKFAVYDQVVIGNTTAATTRLITDSRLGQLIVFAEPLTLAISPLSLSLGTLYGTITGLTGGAGSDTQFLSFDFHIKGIVAVEGSKSEVDVDGTIVSIGAISNGANPITPILGGTGDFLGAKGFIIGTLVAGPGDPTATYKQEFTVWCDLPAQAN